MARRRTVTAAARAGIEGVRDITSGVAPLVVRAVAGPTALGWVLVAATADAFVVRTDGGTPATALGVHVLTAAALLAAGLVLAPG